MCITERQTVMDKELDYGQTEERDRKKARAGKTGTYIFLTFWALVVLFPFYWMLLTSVKATVPITQSISRSCLRFRRRRRTTQMRLLLYRWANTCSIR